MEDVIDDVQQKRETLNFRFGDWEWEGKVDDDIHTINIKIAKDGCLLTKSINDTIMETKDFFYDGHWYQHRFVFNFPFNHKYFIVNANNQEMIFGEGSGDSGIVGEVLWQKKFNRRLT